MTLRFNTGLTGVRKYKVKRRAPVRAPAKRRVNRNASSSGSLGKAKLPFPANMYTTLTYSANHALSLANPPVAVERAIRGNSIRDPNYDESGATPDNRTVIGHGLLKEIYNRYIVLGCVVKVTFNDPTADGAIGYVSLSQDTNLAGLTLRDLMRTPNTITKPINASGEQKTSITMRVTPWQLNAISKAEYMTNSDLYAALMTASPTKNAWIRWGLVGANDAMSGTPTLSATVNVSYLVRLYDRKTLLTDQA